jgi:hypothetical protein
LLKSIAQNKNLKAAETQCLSTSEIEAIWESLRNATHSVLLEPHQVAEFLEFGCSKDIRQLVDVIRRKRVAGIQPEELLVFIQKNEPLVCASLHIPLIEGIVQPIRIFIILLYLDVSDSVLNSCFSLESFQLNLALVTLWLNFDVFTPSILERSLAFAGRNFKRLSNSFYSLVACYLCILWEMAPLHSMFLSFLEAFTSHEQLSSPDCFQILEEVSSKALLRTISTKDQVQDVFQQSKILRGNDGISIALQDLAKLNSRSLLTVFQVLGLLSLPLPSSPDLLEALLSSSGNVKQNVIRYLFKTAASSGSDDIISFCLNLCRNEFISSLESADFSWFNLLDCNQVKSVVDRVSPTLARLFISYVSSDVLNGLLDSLDDVETINCLDSCLDLLNVDLHFLEKLISLQLKHSEDHLATYSLIQGCCLKLKDSVDELTSSNLSDFQKFISTKITTCEENFQVLFSCLSALAQLLKLPLDELEDVVEACLRKVSSISEALKMSEDLTQMGYSNEKISSLLLSCLSNKSIVFSSTMLEFLLSSQKDSAANVLSILLSVALEMNDSSSVRFMEVLCTLDLGLVLEAFALSIEISDSPKSWSEAFADFLNKFKWHSAIESSFESLASIFRYLVSRSEHDRSVQSTLGLLLQYTSPGAFLFCLEQMFSRECNLNELKVSLSMFAFVLQKETPSALSMHEVFKVLDVLPLSSCDAEILQECIICLNLVLLKFKGKTRGRIEAYAFKAIEASSSFSEESLTSSLLLLLASTVSEKDSVLFTKCSFLREILLQNLISMSEQVFLAALILLQSYLNRLSTVSNEDICQLIGCIVSQKQSNDVIDALESRILHRALVLVKPHVLLQFLVRGIPTMPLESNYEILRVIKFANLIHSVEESSTESRTFIVIFKFYLLLLEKLGEREVDEEIVAALVDNLAVIVLKRSEKHMKSLLLKLIEFSSGFVNSFDMNSCLRTRVLFRFSQTLAQKLGPIFFPYFSYLFDLFGLVFTKSKELLALHHGLDILVSCIHSLEVACIRDTDGDFIRNSFYSRFVPLLMDQVNAFLFLLSDSLRFLWLAIIKTLSVQK